MIGCQASVPSGASMSASAVVPPPIQVPVELSVTGAEGRWIELGYALPAGTPASVFESVYESFAGPTPNAAPVPRAMPATCDPWPTRSAGVACASGV